jgi:hypothetical protein
MECETCKRATSMMLRCGCGANVCVECKLNCSTLQCDCICANCSSACEYCIKERICLKHAYICWKCFMETCGNCHFGFGECNTCRHLVGCKICGTCANKACQRVTQRKSEPKPKLKKKRTTIPKPKREAVWRAMYPFHLDAICSVCNRNAISAFRFHCGHIVAAAKGGSDDTSNMQPICDECNYSMGTESIPNFKKRLK